MLNFPTVKNYKQLQVWTLETDRAPAILPSQLSLLELKSPILEKLNLAVDTIGTKFLDPLDKDGFVIIIFFFDKKKIRYLKNELL